MRPRLVLPVCGYIYICRTPGVGDGSLVLPVKCGKGVPVNTAGPRHASQISVELGVVIDSPARRNAAAAAERQRVAEDIVMNDPYVQSLVRDYGAKIVPGSIKPA